LLIAGNLMKSDIMVGDYIKFFRHGVIWTVTEVYEKHVTAREVASVPRVIFEERCLIHEILSARPLFNVGNKVWTHYPESGPDLCTVNRVYHCDERGYLYKCSGGVHREDVLFPHCGDE
jgi:hypothetical protein